MISLELPKSDPRIAHLVRGYKGRKPIRVSAATSHHLNDSWEGGSRDYTTFRNLTTGEQLGRDQMEYAQQTANNPFNQAIGEVQIKPGTVVVVDCVFQGKTMAPRLYCHPQDYPKFQ